MTPSPTSVQASGNMYTIPTLQPGDACGYDPRTPCSNCPEGSAAKPNKNPLSRAEFYCKGVPPPTDGSCTGAGGSGLCSSLYCCDGLTKTSGYYGYCGCSDKQICQPGSKKCDNQFLLTCTKNGGGYETERCASWCDSTKLSCTSVVVTVSPKPGEAKRVCCGKTKSCGVDAQGARIKGNLINCKDNGGTCKDGACVYPPGSKGADLYGTVRYSLVKNSYCQPEQNGTYATSYDCDVALNLVTASLPTPPAVSAVLTGTPAPIATPAPFGYRSDAEIAAVQQKYLGTPGKPVECGTSGAIAIGPGNAVYGCGTDGLWKNLTKQAGIGPEYLTEGNRPSWGIGSKTFASAQAQAAIVNETNAMADVYAKLGLPVPTPLPFASCSSGATELASGSVVIGPIGQSGNDIWECGTDGLWKECASCVLTTIPVYLQTKEGYLQKVIKGDAALSAAFSEAYDACMAQNPSRPGDCVTAAANSTQQVKIATTASAYALALQTCKTEHQTTCPAANDVLATSGLTGVGQHAAIAQAAVVQLTAQTTAQTESGSGVFTPSTPLGILTSDITTIRKKCEEVKFGNTSCTDRDVVKYTNALLSIMSPEERQAYDGIVQKSQEIAKQEQVATVKDSPGYKDYLKTNPKATPEEFIKANEASFTWMASRMVRLGQIEADPNGLKYQKWLNDVATGQVNMLPIQKDYKDQTNFFKHPFAATVLLFNGMTQGATKRGNDLLQSQFENCAGKTSYLQGCDFKKDATVGNVVSGAVMQGAAPAAAAVSLVAGSIIAIPIVVGVAAAGGSAMAVGATALAYGGTAFGAYNAVSTWTQTAEYCNAGSIQENGDAMCKRAALNSGAQMALLFVGAGAAQAQVGAQVAGARQGVAVLKGAAQAQAAVANGISGATTTKALNIAANTANSLYFGYQAYDACVNGVPVDAKGTLQKDGVSCGTNLAMAAVSLARLGTAVVLPNTQQAAAAANIAADYADVGVNGAQAALVCTSGDMAACGNALAGLGMSLGGAKLSSSQSHGSLDNSTTILYEEAELNLRGLYADPTDPKNGKYAPGVTKQQVRTAEEIFNQALVARGQEKGLIELAMKPLNVAENDLTGIQKNLVAAQKTYQAAADEYAKVADLPVAELKLHPAFKAYQESMQQLLSINKAVSIEQEALTVPKALKDSDAFKAYEDARTEFERIAKTLAVSDPAYQQAFEKLATARQGAVETGYTKTQVEMQTALKARQEEYRQTLEKASTLQEDHVILTDPAQAKIILDRTSEQLTNIQNERTGLGNGEVTWDAAATRWVAPDGSTVSDLVSGRYSFDPDARSWIALADNSDVSPTIVFQEQNRLLGARRSQLDAQIVAYTAKITHLYELQGVRENAAQGDANAQAYIKNVQTEVQAANQQMNNINQQVTALTKARNQAGTFLEKIREALGWHVTVEGVVTRAQQSETPGASQLPLDRAVAREAARRGITDPAEIARLRAQVEAAVEAKPTLREKTRDFLLGPPDEPNFLGKIFGGETTRLGAQVKDTQQAYQEGKIAYRSKITEIRPTDTDGNTVLTLGKMTEIDTDANGKLAAKTNGIALDVSKATKIQDITDALRSAGAKNGRYAVDINGEQINVLYQDGSLYLDAASERTLGGGIFRLPDNAVRTENRLGDTGGLSASQKKIVDRINGELAAYEQRLSALTEGKLASETTDPVTGEKVRKGKIASIRGIEAGEKNQLKVLADAMLTGEGRGILFEALTGSGKTTVLIPEIAALKAKITGKDVFTVLNTQGDLRNFVAEYVDIPEGKQLSDLSITEIRTIEQKLSRALDEPVVILDGTNKRATNEIADGKIFLTTKDVIFESIKGVESADIMQKAKGAVLLADEAQLSLRLDVDYVISQGARVQLGNTTEGKKYIDTFERVMQEDSIVKQALEMVAEGEALAQAGDKNAGRLKIQEARDLLEITTAGGDRARVGNKVLENQLYAELLLQAAKKSGNPDIQAYIEKEFLTEAIASSPDAYQEKLLQFLNTKEIAGLDTEVLNRFKGEFQNRKTAAEAIVDQIGKTAGTDFVVKDGKVLLADGAAISGRTPSRAYDALALEVIGGKLWTATEGEPVVVNTGEVSVTSSSISTNYARFLQNFPEIYGFTGTPDYVKAQFETVYGINLGKSSVGQADFVLSESGVHTPKSIQTAQGVAAVSTVYTQTAGVRGGRQPVEHVVIATGKEPSSVVIEKLRIANPDADFIVRSPNGDHYLVEAGQTTKIPIGDLAGVDGEIAQYRTGGAKAGKRVVTVYAYGAHYGVDSVTRTTEPFTVIVGKDTTLTTFLQAAGRDRGTDGYSRLDVIGLDIPSTDFGGAAITEQMANTRKFFQKNEDTLIARNQLASLKRVADNLGPMTIDAIETAAGQRLFGGTSVADQTRVTAFLDRMRSELRVMSEIDTNIGSGQIDARQDLLDSVNRVQGFLRGMETRPDFQSLPDAAKQEYRRLVNTEKDSYTISDLTGPGNAETFTPLNNLRTLDEFVATIKAAIPPAILDQKVSRGGATAPQVQDFSGSVKPPSGPTLPSDADAPIGGGKPIQPADIAASAVEESAITTAKQTIASWQGKPVSTRTPASRIQVLSGLATAKLAQTAAQNAFAAAQATTVQAAVIQAQDAVTNAQQTVQTIVDGLLDDVTQRLGEQIGTETVDNSIFHAVVQAIINYEYTANEVISKLSATEKQNISDPIAVDQTYPELQRVRQEATAALTAYRTMTSRAFDVDTVLDDVSHPVMSAMILVAKPAAAGPQTAAPVGKATAPAATPTKPKNILTQVSGWMKNVSANWQAFISQQQQKPIIGSIGVRWQQFWGAQKDPNHWTRRKDGAWILLNTDFSIKGLVSWGVIRLATGLIPSPVLSLPSKALWVYDLFRIGRWMGERAVSVAATAKNVSKQATSISGIGTLFDRLSTNRTTKIGQVVNATPKQGTWWVSRGVLSLIPIVNYITWGYDVSRLVRWIQHGRPAVYSVKKGATPQTEDSTDILDIKTDPLKDLTIADDGTIVGMTEAPQNVINRDILLNPTYQSRIRQAIALSRTYPEKELSKYIYKVFYSKGTISDETGMFYNALTPDQVRQMTTANRILLGATDADTGPWFSRNYGPVVGGEQGIRVVENDPNRGPSYVGRIYLNPNVEYTALVFRALQDKLRATGTSVTMKMINITRPTDVVDLEAATRPDKIVIYFSPDAQQDVMRILDEVSTAAEGYHTNLEASGLPLHTTDAFRLDTPKFSAQLFDINGRSMRGIAFVQQRATQQSFGSMISNLLQEMYENGIDITNPGKVASQLPRYLKAYNRSATQPFVTEEGKNLFIDIMSRTTVKTPVVVPAVPAVVPAVPVASAVVPEVPISSVILDANPTRQVVLNGRFVDAGGAPIKIGDVGVSLSSSSYDFNIVRIIGLDYRDGLPSISIELMATVDRGGTHIQGKNKNNWWFKNGKYAHSNSFRIISEDDLNNTSWKEKMQAFFEYGIALRNYFDISGKHYENPILLNDPSVDITKIQEQTQNIFNLTKVEEAVKLEAARVAAEQAAQAKQAAEQATQVKAAADAEAAKAQSSSKASIPFMITRDMRQQLTDLGYTSAQIGEMTPTDAWDIIQNNKTAPRQSKGQVYTITGDQAAIDARRADVKRFFGLAGNRNALILTLLAADVKGKPATVNVLKTWPDKPALDTNDKDTTAFWQEMLDGYRTMARGMQDALGNAFVAKKGELTKAVFIADNPHAVISAGVKNIASEVMYSGKSIPKPIREWWVTQTVQQVTEELTPQLDALSQKRTAARAAFADVPQGSISKQWFTSDLYPRVKTVLGAVAIDPDLAVLEPLAADVSERIAESRQQITQSMIQSRIDTAFTQGLNGKEAHTQNANTLDKQLTKLDVDITTVRSSTKAKTPAYWSIQSLTEAFDSAFASGHDQYVMKTANAVVTETLKPLVKGDVRTAALAAWRGAGKGAEGAVAFIRTVAEQAEQQTSGTNVTVSSLSVWYDIVNTLQDALRSATIPGVDVATRGIDLIESVRRVTHRLIQAENLERVTDAVAKLEGLGVAIPSSYRDTNDYPKMVAYAYTQKHAIDTADPEAGVTIDSAITGLANAIVRLLPSGDRETRAIIAMMTLDEHITGDEPFGIVRYVQEETTITASQITGWIQQLDPILAPLKEKRSALAEKYELISAQRQAIGTIEAQTTAQNGNGVTPLLTRANRELYDALAQSRVNVNEITNDSQMPDSEEALFNLRGRAEGVLRRYQNASSTLVQDIRSLISNDVLYRRNQILRIQLDRIINNINDQILNVSTHPQAAEFRNAIASIEHWRIVANGTSIITLDDLLSAVKTVRQADDATNNMFFYDKGMIIQVQSQLEGYTYSPDSLASEISSILYNPLERVIEQAATTYGVGSLRALAATDNEARYATYQGKNSFDKYAIYLLKAVMADGQWNVNAVDALVKKLDAALKSVSLEYVVKPIDTYIQNLHAADVQRETNINDLIKLRQSVAEAFNQYGNGPQATWNDAEFAQKLFEWVMGIHQSAEQDITQIDGQINPYTELTAALQVLLDTGGYAGQPITDIRNTHMLLEFGQTHIVNPASDNDSSVYIGAYTVGNAPPNHKNYRDNTFIVRDDSIFTDRQVLIHKTGGKWRIQQTWDKEEWLIVDGEAIKNNTRTLSVGDHMIIVSHVMSLKIAVNTNGTVSLTRVQNSADQRELFDGAQAQRANKEKQRREIIAAQQAIDRIINTVGKEHISTILPKAGEAAQSGMVGVITFTELVIRDLLSQIQLARGDVSKLTVLQQAVQKFIAGITTQFPTVDFVQRLTPLLDAVTREMEAIEAENQAEQQGKTEGLSQEEWLSMLKTELSDRSGIITLLVTQENGNIAQTTAFHEDEKAPQQDQQSFFDDVTKTVLSLLPAHTITLFFTADDGTQFAGTYSKNPFGRIVAKPDSSPVSVRSQDVRPTEVFTPISPFLTPQQQGAIEAYIQEIERIADTAGREVREQELIAEAYARSKSKTTTAHNDSVFSEGSIGIPEPLTEAAPQQEQPSAKEMTVVSETEKITVLVEKYIPSVWKKLSLEEQQNLVAGIEATIQAVENDENTKEFISEYNKNQVRKVLLVNHIKYQLQSYLQDQLIKTDRMRGEVPMSLLTGLTDMVLANLLPSQPQTAKKTVSVPKTVGTSRTTTDAVFVDVLHVVRATIGTRLESLLSDMLLDRTITEVLKQYEQTIPSPLKNLQQLARKIRNELLRTAVFPGDKTQTIDGNVYSAGDVGVWTMSSKQPLDVVRDEEKKVVVRVMRLDGTVDLVSVKPNASMPQNLTNVMLPLDVVVLPLSSGEKLVLQLVRKGGDTSDGSAATDALWKQFVLPEEAQTGFLAEATGDHTVSSTTRILKRVSEIGEVIGDVMDSPQVQGNQGGYVGAKPASIYVTMGVAMLPDTTPYRIKQTIRRAIEVGLSAASIDTFVTAGEYFKNVPMTDAMDTIFSELGDQREEAIALYRAVCFATGYTKQHVWDPSMVSSVKRTIAAVHVGKTMDAKNIRTERTLETKEQFILASPSVIAAMFVSYQPYVRTKGVSLVDNSALHQALAGYLYDALPAAETVEEKAAAESVPIKQLFPLTSGLKRTLQNERKVFLSQGQWQASDVFVASLQTYAEKQLKDQPNLSETEKQAYTNQFIEQVTHELAAVLGSTQNALVVKIEEAAAQSRKEHGNYTEWGRVKELMDPELLAGTGYLSSDLLDYFAETRFNSIAKQSLPSLIAALKKQMKNKEPVFTAEANRLITILETYTNQQSFIRFDAMAVKRAYWMSSVFPTYKVTSNKSDISAQWTETESGSKQTKDILIERTSKWKPFAAGAGVEMHVRKTFFAGEDQLVFRTTIDHRIIGSVTATKSSVNWFQHARAAVTQLFHTPFMARVTYSFLTALLIGGIVLSNITTAISLIGATQIALNTPTLSAAMPLGIDQITASTIYTPAETVQLTAPQSNLNDAMHSVYDAAPTVDAFVLQPLYERIVAERSARAVKEGDSFWYPITGKHLSELREEEQQAVLTNPIVNIPLLVSDGNLAGNDGLGLDAQKMEETLSTSRNDATEIISLNTQTGQIDVVITNRMMLMADGKQLNLLLHEPDDPMGHARTDLEYMTGVPMDALLVMDREYVRTVIDVLYPEGISIKVDEDMRRENGEVVFTKGVHQMHGEDAVLYMTVRQIQNEAGFHRDLRQAQVLKKILLDLLQSESVGDKFDSLTRFLWTTQENSGRVVMGTDLTGFSNGDYTLEYVADRIRYVEQLGVNADEGKGQQALKDTLLHPNFYYFVEANAIPVWNLANYIADKANVTFVEVYQPADKNPNYTGGAGYYTPVGAKKFYTNSLENYFDPESLTYYYPETRAVWAENAISSLAHMPDQVSEGTAGEEQQKPAVIPEMVQEQQTGTKTQNTGTSEGPSSDTQEQIIIQTIEQPVGLVPQSQSQSKLTPQKQAKKSETGSLNIGLIGEGVQVVFDAVRNRLSSFVTFLRSSISERGSVTLPGLFPSTKTRGEKAWIPYVKPAKWMKETLQKDKHAVLVEFDEQTVASRKKLLAPNIVNVPANDKKALFTYGNVFRSYIFAPVITDDFTDHIGQRRPWLEGIYQTIKETNGTPQADTFSAWYQANKLSAGEMGSVITALLSLDMEFPGIIPSEVITRVNAILQEFFTPYREVKRTDTGKLEQITKYDELELQDKMNMMTQIEEFAWQGMDAIGRYNNQFTNNTNIFNGVVEVVQKKFNQILLFFNSPQAERGSLTIPNPFPQTYRQNFDIPLDGTEVAFNSGHVAMLNEAQNAPGLIQEKHSILVGEPASTYARISIADIRAYVQAHPDKNPVILNAFVQELRQYWLSEIIVLMNMYEQQGSIDKAIEYGEMFLKGASYVEHYLAAVMSFANPAEQQDLDKIVKYHQEQLQKRDAIKTRVEELKKQIHPEINLKDCLSDARILHRVYAAEESTEQEEISCPWYMRAPVKVIRNTLFISGISMLVIDAIRSARAFQQQYLAFLSSNQPPPVPPYTALRSEADYMYNTYCPMGSCEAGCGENFECSAEGRCCQPKNEASFCSTKGNVFIKSDPMSFQDTPYWPSIELDEFNRGYDKRGAVEYCKNGTCDPETGCAEQAQRCDTPGEIDVIGGGLVETLAFICDESGKWVQMDIEDLPLVLKQMTCSDDKSAVLDVTTKKVLKQCDGNSACFTDGSSPVACYLLSRKYGCSSNQTQLFGGFKCTRQGLTCTPGEQFGYTLEEPCARTCGPDGKSQELTVPSRCSPSAWAYIDRMCKGNDVYDFDSTRPMGEQNLLLSCPSGCREGMCIGHVGGGCSDEGDIVAGNTDEENNCPLICRNGSYQKVGFCHHVDVLAYNNENRRLAYETLSQLPESLFKGMRVPVVMTWKRSEEDGYLGRHINFYNTIIPYVTMNQADSITNKETLIHEFFHAWVYDKLSSAFVALTNPMLKKLVNAGDTTWYYPIDYMHLTGCVYNDSNQFDYTLPPVTGYGGGEAADIPCHEDFADSAEWYVMNACELKARSPERYTYFRDTLFGGKEYIPSGGCTSN